MNIIILTDQQLKAQYSISAKEVKDRVRGHASVEQVCRFYDLVNEMLKRGLDV